MTLVTGEPYWTDLRNTTPNDPFPDAARKVALDRLLAELSAVVFASLPRADQRRKGVMYLRGLLGAPGRKSVRNIAAFLGEQVNDQGLHHFVNDSTWAWEPMREALGRYLARHTAPQACVVQPMTIPKSGTHSVGVGRTYSWESGKAVTAQQAVGVWAASPAAAVPVHWRLHLPPRRPGEAAERPGAPRGEEAVRETPEHSVVRAYLDTVARHRLPHGPVVLNGERLDGVAVAAQLRAAGAAQLSRIRQDTWLLPADPALPGWADTPLPARRIARLTRIGRHGVTLMTTGTADVAELVATVRVRLPALPDASGRARGIGDFVLFCAGPACAQWPAELWLTDLTTADPGVLLRLACLGRRVGTVGMRRAEQVGIRDFVGRSFAGWHRHATLASVAHAVTELAERAVPDA
ncbi:IS701 family transposase [Streptomyces sp. URMC 126]|uniref:IS701 family transposase n=1 Tax=Streptomyces sp. URMC 126 TaxID=3423401 RepID=UPI003F1B2413